MNLQVYGGNNVGIDGGGAINYRSNKQLALRASLAAYAGANGPVDVAGFTEVRAGTTNLAVIGAGLVDLAASLNMPGGAVHIILAHCGNSALGVGEFIGIAIRGDAVLNGWGRVYDTGNPPTVVNQMFVVAGGGAHRLRETAAPPGATLDRRCIVYVDVTLPNVALRVGYIHNLYVLRDNRIVILDRLPSLIDGALIDYVGGDFNASPRNIRSLYGVQRLRPTTLHALSPGVATTTGGNTYDWWARTRAFGATAIAVTQLNNVASDHCGVGITF
jgi:hypothetical protein